MGGGNGFETPPWLPSSSSGASGPQIQGVTYVPETPLEALPPDSTETGQSRVSGPVVPRYPPTSTQRVLDLDEVSDE